MANKFRVGDRVKVKCGDLKVTKGLVGYVVEIHSGCFRNKCLCRFPGFEGHRGNGLTLRGKDYETADHYYLLEQDLEFADKKTQPIVIYRNGNEVIALDKNTGEKGVAKCNPADKFDFGVGAQLAFDRLVGRAQDASEKKEELLNCKICIVESHSNELKVGKIYEIKDGQFRGDCGFTYPSDDPLVSVDDMADYFQVSGKRRSGGRRGWFSETKYVVVVE